jgi:hypothetical protein
MSWPEIAKQLEKVSGAWSRYRKACRQSPEVWAVGNRRSLMPLTKTLRLATGSRR